eukprot:TRINITY_DN15658_c0_g1_i1.p1 TRINITY_DN15658_c0_g1~~TRINITY_DN15658_c0_g1_i1.p1  ORF type:complete len:270 (+),score=69.58 TRINITY_DN15658_c0_g1_i1:140-949(+)
MDSGKEPLNPAPAKTWGSWLSNTINNAVKDLEKGVADVTLAVDKEVQYWTRNSTQGQFQQLFNYPPTEQLLSTYSGNALNNTTILPGTIYLSQNYYSFYTYRNTPILVSIPWNTITKMQPAKSKAAPASAYKGTLPAAPTFDLLPNETVPHGGDTICLSTSDSRIHCFWGIRQAESVFPEFFNTVRFIWCAQNGKTFVVNVPKKPEAAQQEEEKLIRNTGDNNNNNNNSQQNTTPLLLPQNQNASVGRANTNEGLVDVEVDGEEDESII